MEESEFIIKRPKQPSIDVNDTIIKIVRIKKAIFSPSLTKKLISQFRFEQKDSEFDMILNVVQMNVNIRMNNLALEQLEFVRMTLFKRLSGEKLLVTRLSCGNDVGTLNVIPIDLYKKIV